MNKILLIIQREYLSRVKKKSFLLMTFLVPALFIGMISLVVYLTTKGDDHIKNFKVLDQSGIFEHQFNNSNNLNFSYIKGNYEEAKKDIRLSRCSGCPRIRKFNQYLDD